MDSQTASSSAPDPMAAMFQNATIEKAEGSEFCNSAGDMFKFAVNNHFNFSKEECSDVINYLKNALPPLLAEVRKNDQSRSIVDETTGVDGSDPGPVPQAATTDHTLKGDPVDVIDIISLDPSLLSISSTADRYARAMLKCLAGYALYDPKPLSQLSKEYLRHGVNVGDVGFVRGDGAFDFLFNICTSQNGLINPPNLPDGFSFDAQDHCETRNVDPLARNTCLFQNPVTKTKSGEYICEGSEGAILVLPEGAIQEEAMNIRPFAKLAARHGVQWYEYTMNRGREISNGSLYLITSFTKCAQWGIAVFDRQCVPGQGLRFDKKRTFPFGKSSSKYHWKGSDAFLSKVSKLNQGDTPNQCVFLRGYKIMIRRDIFDNLYNDQHGSDPAVSSSSFQLGSSTMTRQPATRIRGGGGSDLMLKTLGRSLWSRSKDSTSSMSDDVVLYANFNPSPVHPSDLINATLLSQNPSAKVALTHDDVWCNILQGNFPKLDYATLVNIARSYTNTVDENNCASLERISNSSNVLEAEKPVVGLWGPLTTSDYVYNPPTLPRELVEYIILFLDTKSILTCRLVNKQFNEIIQSFTVLYVLACKAADVIDNPRSPLSHPERLEALLKREEAWRNMKPVFEKTVKINPQLPLTSFRALTGGACFFADNKKKWLQYLRLPSSLQDNPQWTRLPGDTDDWLGWFVDLIPAIDEHDLIIYIISSDIGNQADVRQHSLELVLFQFSSGKYHPLARYPRIHVHNSFDAQPLVNARITGDHLAFVVQGQDGKFPDKLFIFDWKTGHRRLQHETTTNAYSTLVFVSPELLLVPNQTQFHFEVWHLPPSQINAKSPVQILSLKMPTLSQKYAPLSFRCNRVPSPFLYSTSYSPTRPFFSSPENSIIITNIRFLAISTFSTRPRASYVFVMNCHALLDVIKNWTSILVLEQQTWLTNEVIIHERADPDDRSIRLSTQSKVFLMTPQPRPSSKSGSSQTFATQPSTSHLHVSAHSNSSSISSGSFISSSTSRYNFLQVNWTDWGPPLSRWLPLTELQGRWTTNCAGQRLVFPDPVWPGNSLSTKSRICVADFNPHNFGRSAKMIARLRGKGESDGDNSNNEKGREEEDEEDEEMDMLDHEGVFSEDVYMGLKYVVRRMPGVHDYEVMLMDEERLLGVKYNNITGNLQEIKNFYIG